MTVAAPWTFRRIIGAIFFTSTGLLTAGLCAWQVRRHFWKKELLTKRAASLAASPVPFESDILALVARAWDAVLHDAGAFRLRDYTLALDAESPPHHVTLRGRFDYAREQLVGFTAAPVDVKNVKMSDSLRGYYVCTPLVLETPVATTVPLRPTIPLLKGFPIRMRDVILRAYYSHQYQRLLRERAAMPPVEAAALPALPTEEAFVCERWEAQLPPRDDVIALHTKYPAASQASEGLAAAAAAAGTSAAAASPATATVTVSEVLVNRGWVSSTHALSYLGSNRLPEASTEADAAAAATATKALATPGSSVASVSPLTTVSGVFWFGPQRADSAPPTQARIKSSQHLAHQLAYPHVLAAAAGTPPVTIETHVSDDAAEGGPLAPTAAAELVPVLQAAHGLAAHNRANEARLASISRKVAAAALIKERMQLMQEGKDTSDLPIVEGLTPEEAEDAQAYCQNPELALKSTFDTVKSAFTGVPVALSEGGKTGSEAPVRAPLTDWYGAGPRPGGAYSDVFKAYPLVELTGEEGPWQRVAARDEELSPATSVRLSLRRKSAADYSNFHSQPVTHLIYAATWGTLSSVAFYVAYSRFWRKRISNPALFKSISHN